MTKLEKKIFREEFLEQLSLVDYNFKTRQRVEIKTYFWVKYMNDQKYYGSSRWEWQHRSIWYLLCQPGRWRSPPVPFWPTKSIGFIFKAYRNMVVEQHTSQSILVNKSCKAEKSKVNIPNVYIRISSRFFRCSQSREKRLWQIFAKNNTRTSWKIHKGSIAIFWMSKENTVIINRNHNKLDEITSLFWTLIS